MKHVESKATINKTMEPHTHALEVVCRHFKQEYGTEALLKLRREKNRLASQNYRLRKKNENMEIRIKHLLEQNERIFITHRKLVMQMRRARESLAVVSPFL